MCLSLGHIIAKARLIFQVVFVRRCVKHGYIQVELKISGRLELLLIESGIKWLSFFML